MFELDESLYTIAPEGGGPIFLGRGSAPQWAPDGRIVFTSGYDLAANRRAVYVMPLDGGERRRVTGNGYAPIWSPDGDYLAFTRITECGHAVCSGRIFVMPVDDGEARPVSRLIGDPGGAVAWIR